ncbi:MAG: ABC transporter ATP-binding protein [Chloroflexota bacterium]|jgi:branched-chain amino acid transport system ATP-binding protein|nr:ABC transporter ATP-binding protein [Chloroflexota bacterium]
MLTVNNINVFYGSVQALWDVSFEVKQGEIVTLVGSNGAGKTTSIKTISGLLSPQSGSITLNGERLDKAPAHKIVDMGIAQVPEGRRLWAGMSVRDTLELGTYLPRARADKAKNIEWVLSLFPRLKERLSQAADTMSGGEQQMLAISRALLSKPKLLMLDEPSLGLAPVIVENVFDVIRQINQQGMTILLVEQNVNHALNLSTRAYVLETGHVVKSGNSVDLMNDPQVKSAYLGL